MNWIMNKKDDILSKFNSLELFIWLISPKSYPTDHHVIENLVILIVIITSLLQLYKQCKSTSMSHTVMA